MGTGQGPWRDLLMGRAHDEICSLYLPDEHVSQWTMVSELHDKTHFFPCNAIGLILKLERQLPKPKGQLPSLPPPPPPASFVFEWLSMPCHNSSEILSNYDVAICEKLRYAIAQANSNRWNFGDSDSTWWLTPPNGPEGFKLLHTLIPSASSSAAYFIYCLCLCLCIRVAPQKKLEILCSLPAPLLRFIIGVRYIQKMSPKNDV